MVMVIPMKETLLSICADILYRNFYRPWTHFIDMNCKDAFLRYNIGPLDTRQLNTLLRTDTILRSEFIQDHLISYQPYVMQYWISTTKKRPRSRPIDTIMPDWANDMISLCYYWNHFTLL